MLTKSISNDFDFDEWKPKYFSDIVELMINVEQNGLRVKMRNIFSFLFFIHFQFKLLYEMDRHLLTTSTTRKIETKESYEITLTKIKVFFPSSPLSNRIDSLEMKINRNSYLTFSLN